MICSPQPPYLETDAILTQICGIYCLEAQHQYGPPILVLQYQEFPNNIMNS